MKIFLSPQVCDKKLVVTKKGDALTINGASFDFTQLPLGGFLPGEAIGSDIILGDVTRDADGLVLTLFLPIAVDAPDEANFPQPLINPADGELKFPKGTNV